MLCDYCRSFVLSVFIIPILFVSILRFHSAELKTKKAIGHIMTVPEAE